MLSFSDLMGYTSIGCWLFAQFPQVLENIRNQSSDGLDLPFLLNWLLGDISNLVGCILTHQLPFQTWLATYFVFVDFSLFSQYFYYGWKASKKTQRPIHTRRRSTIRRSSASRYRTLSTAAANVAAAAALAAQHEVSPPELRSGRARLPHSRTRTHDRSVSVELTREDDDEVDEEALAALAESFHSESGRHRHSKRVSWNQDFSGFARVPAPLSPLMSSNAPPSLRITTNNSEVSVATRSTILRSVSSDNLEGPSYTSESPTATRASKKSAGLVLLGVGFLFAMGSMPAGNHSALSSQSNLGRVLDLGPAPIINAAIHSSPSMHPLRTEPVVLRFDGNVLKSRAGQDDPVSTERLLGRFFAWLCTTLYLTSRLPQIWKNYARKSVEGLSMYLFVFAFLGNVFYVTSILTSDSMFLPPPEAAAFLKESIPYLLGSGGTLCFDITIVAQSFIYRPKCGRRGRMRGKDATQDGALEEQAGLLQDDELVQPPNDALRGETSVDNQRVSTNRNASIHS